VNSTYIKTHGAKIKIDLSLFASAMLIRYRYTKIIWTSPRV